MYFRLAKDARELFKVGDEGEQEQEENESESRRGSSRP